MVDSAKGHCQLKLDKDFGFTSKEVADGQDKDDFQSSGRMETKL